MKTDGTVMRLKKLGIPVTRENYLRLAFAGDPPDEPLDGEIEAELPRSLQMNVNRLHLTAADCQFLHDVGIRYGRAAFRSPLSVLGVAK